MTTEELNREWDYRYKERIGILCGSGDPTEAQKALAAKEADETINALKNELRASVEK